MSNLSVQKDLCDALMEDARIGVLVGDNIFPVAAPLDTCGDFIILARSEYAVKRTQMGTAEETATILINVVSTDYARGLEIAEAVRTVLTSPPRVPEVRLTDAEENITGWADGAVTKYVQALFFEVSSLTVI